MDKSNHSSNSTLRGGADSNFSLQTSSSISSDDNKLNAKPSVIFKNNTNEENGADTKFNTPGLLSDISLKTAQSMSFEADKDVNVKPSVIRAISKNSIKAKSSNTDANINRDEKEKVHETGDGEISRKLQDLTMFDTLKPKPNEPHRESFPVKPNTNVAVAHFFRMSTFNRNEIDTKKEINILERFPKSEEIDSDATLVPVESPYLQESFSNETQEYECAKTSSEIMQTEENERLNYEQKVKQQNFSYTKQEKSNISINARADTISNFVPKIFGDYNHVTLGEQNNFKIKELRDQYEQKTGRETKVNVQNSETQSASIINPVPETWNTLIDTIEKSILRLESTITEKVVSEIRSLNLMKTVPLEPIISVEQKIQLEPKIQLGSKIPLEPKIPLDPKITIKVPKLKEDKKSMIENPCQCSLLPSTVIDDLSATKEEKKESELWSSASYSNQVSLVVSDKSDQAVLTDAMAGFKCFFLETGRLIKENAILITSAVLFIVLMILLYCVILVFSRVV